MAATERVVVYLTKEDKERLYEAAKAAGEHASQWSKKKLILALGPVRQPMRSDE